MGGVVPLPLVSFHVSTYLKHPAHGLTTGKGGGSTVDFGAGERTPVAWQSEGLMDGLLAGGRENAHGPVEGADSSGN